MSKQREIKLPFQVGERVIYISNPRPYGVYGEPELASYGVVVGINIRLNGKSLTYGFKIKSDNPWDDYHLECSRTYSKIFPINSETEKVFKDALQRRKWLDTMDNFGYFPLSKRRLVPPWNTNRKIDYIRLKTTTGFQPVSEFELIRSRYNPELLEEVEQ